MPPNIELTCSALEGALADTATVTEEISQPTRADLALELSPTSDLTDADALLGQSAVVSWGDRHYPLVITEVDQPDLDTGSRRYALVLEHPMALLRYRRDHRTFLEKSVKDIVTTVIGAASLTPIWSASRGTSPRTVCVQYGETDFDFVQRLLAEEGVFWFCPDDESEPKVSFADAASAFTAIGGPSSEIAFQGEDRGEGIIDLEIERHVTPGAVSLVDYDFEKPGVDLTARSTIDESPAGEHFEYPGGYTTAADGAAYAKIRAEEIASTKVRVSGISSCTGFQAGRTFDLSSIYEDAPNGSYLLRRVEHSYGMRYRNRFVASPLALPYRPARVARPVIGGALSATIMAPATTAETIHTDKYGRFKAQYAFDRLGKSTDASSQWIRLTQPMVGGSMMLARVEWEIVLRHLDGDLDRPIGIARMFDGTHPPPETVPANKTKTSFGTFTSTGAAKINSIVFDDKAGSMLFAVTAAKDLDATVLHDETESIGANDTLAVGQDNTVLIGDKQVTLIEKNETMTAKKDAGVAVAGDRTKSITKDETATVDGGVSVRVDGNDEETVGKDLTITADEGFLETAKGKYDLSVTGAVMAKSKKDYTIWIGGKSSETVGAARTTKSDDGTVTEAVKGDVTVNIGGAWTEQVDGNRTSSAQGEMQRTVAAAATLTATGKLQIKAKTIKITVGGAATFVGGGATLSFSPASVAFLGLVTLKGSSGVEVAGAPQLAG